MQGHSIRLEWINLKIRRNISLDDAVLEKGLSRATELGLNFSSYITNLINQDSKGIVIQEVKQEQIVQAPSEEMIDDDLMDDIDSIIG